MNSKNLLALLSDLETALQQFSYNTLTADEAQELKESLDIFRQHLTAKMHESPQEEKNEPHGGLLQANEEQKEAVLQRKNQLKQADDISAGLSNTSRFEEYLKDSPLSKKQLDYINTILAQAEITTRISNAHEGPENNNKENDPDSSPDHKTSNSMKTSGKPVSDVEKHSKLSEKESLKIDLIPILEECLGQKDLLEELIKLYKQNALEFIGQLKIHIQNLDFESIRFSAHKIKSGLKMMNTPELLVIAEQIEAVSKTDQDIKHLEFLFACFVKEYPGVERAIDEEFKKLK